MRRFRLASRLLQADLAGKIRYLTPRVQGKVPDPEKFIRDLAQYDPSGQKGDYLPVLVSYALTGKKITPKIKQALTWHHQYKRNLPPELRDSNKLDLGTFPKQIPKLQKLHGTPDYFPSGAKIIYQEGPYQVVEITSRKAACYYFEQGGRWCTGNPETPSHYKNYSGSGPLVVILKNQKPWVQYSVGRGELKNSQNQVPNLPVQSTVLSLLHRALPQDQGIAAEIQNVNSELARIKALEAQADMAQVLSSPESAYLYAVDVMLPLGKTFPAGEPVIATSAQYSYLYARDVMLPLGKTFPAGESKIATSAQYSYLYARDVLKPFGKTFPAGEPVIATNAYYSYLYALQVMLPLGKTFPAGEPVIATNAGYSYEYARDVLHDPDPKTWGRRYLAQHRGQV